MTDTPASPPTAATTATTTPKSSTSENVIAILSLFVLPLAFLFASILVNDHILSSYHPILVSTMGLPYVLYGIYGLRKGRVWLLGSWLSRAPLELLGVRFMKWGLKDGNGAKQVAIRYIIFGVIIIVTFIIIGVASHEIYSTLPPETQAIW